MSDGMIKTPMTVDTTSPIEPRYTYTPHKYREILQRQMQFTSDRVVDQAVSFTIGGSDGRFLSNFPGETLQRENADGAQFHMVGVNRADDLSVAAP